MYLLDTMALSDLRRPGRANPGLLAWARSVAPSHLFLSAVSVLEIELGALLAGRKDPAKGSVLRTWIETQVLSAFRGRILPIDTAVAQCCAALHVPVPRPERDSLIAATALVHRLTVVTRNLRDFEPMGVSVVNPWQ